jgi:phenylalanyl-tRNA synthetase beta chain
MNTSLSWIKRYVPDLDVTAQEYADAMTLSGTKVENYEELDKNLDKIVVGEILSCEAHPNSDHLHICMVNVGEAEPLQIVCGAPNVAAGQKVPVVLEGGSVAGSRDGDKNPEGIKIKAGKLRGVESHGMICSIEELGSTHEMYPEAPEYGIYVFPDDTEVGADAIELLGLHDAIIEYEITSNRVDCYSVIGIAREAAATFGKKFHNPEIKITGNDEKASDYIDVEVIDKDLCPRFTARVVKNVKIGPSPKWMQRCLASNGIRPINNVVDITNYVMEEYGQPMHSYDYDMIAGHKIIVKRAKDGDVFTTLDGQERNLDHDVIMICDAEKEVGIGGIMGGENSMITDDVKTVLFEAANFNGTNIRLSSKRIGLQTDASQKFDKGLDPNTAELAVNRACELMEEFGAGEVVGGIVDVYDEVRQPKEVAFEP